MFSRKKERQPKIKRSPTFRNLLGFFFRGDCVREEQVVFYGGGRDVFAIAMWLSPLT